MDEPPPPNPIELIKPTSAAPRRNVLRIGIVGLIAVVLVSAAFFVSSGDSSTDRQLRDLQVTATSQPLHQTVQVSAGKPASDREKMQMVADIIKSGKLEDCAKARGIVIEGADYETVCRNNVMWNTAQSSTDFNVCNGLDNKMITVADCQHLILTNVVNKAKKLAVCDTVPASLKTNCANYYWFLRARDAKDPHLCAKSSSPQVAAGCEYRLLLLYAASPQNTALDCSVFSDAQKTDCLNYPKKDCSAIKFPPLAQQCRR